MESRFGIFRVSIFQEEPQPEIDCTSHRLDMATAKTWSVLLGPSLLNMSALFAEEWTRFRGPNGSGISTDSGFPAEFDPDTKARWKSSIQPGKSSPVLTPRHVFLTSFQGNRLFTQCFDRESGTLFWEKWIERHRSALLHQLNEPASASPVTDGRNVYVFFEDWGLLSYDDQGKLRWKVPLGPFWNEQGLGASPILVDDTLILQVDHAAGSYIAACDTANGETKWKTDRAETDSWTTPLVHRTKGMVRIITASSRLIGAYELSGGRRTMTEVGGSGVMVASPVLAGNTIYAFGYNSESSFAGTLERLDTNRDGGLAPNEYEGDSYLTAIAKYRGDRDGIIEQPDWDDIMSKRGGPSRLVALHLETNGGGQELWYQERGFLSVIPSPLVYDGILYFVKNGGIVTALDAKTGELLKKERLKGAVEGYSASPVAAAGKVYFGSEGGKISVVKAGAAWEVIAVNDLQDAMYATPALSNGAIFARTDTWLYCFRN